MMVLLFMIHHVPVFHERTHVRMCICAYLGIIIKIGFFFFSLLIALQCFRKNILVGSLFLLPIFFFYEYKFEPLEHKVSRYIKKSLVTFVMAVLCTIYASLAHWFFHKLLLRLFLLFSL